MTLISAGDRTDGTRISGTWTEMQIEEDIVKIEGELLNLSLERSSFSWRQQKRCLLAHRVFIGLHYVRAAGFPTVNGTKSEKRKKTESLYLFETVLQENWTDASSPWSRAKSSCRQEIIIFPSVLSVDVEGFWCLEKFGCS